MSEDDPKNQLARVEHGALSLTNLAGSRILSEIVRTSLVLAKDATQSGPETSEQHTARMRGWQFEDAAVLAEGGLQTSRTLPEIRVSMPLSTKDSRPIPADIDALVSEGKSLLLSELVGLTPEDVRKFAYPHGYTTLCKIGRCRMEQRKYGMTDENIRAFSLLLRAAEAGHSEAQFLVAEFCYSEGGGVSKDDLEAVKWFRKSAEQGNRDAQRVLGFIYLNGYLKMVPIDREEGAGWYRKAADQGDSEAQFCLGYCYFTGKGVFPKYAEAVKWTLRAADQNHARAQYGLGICYAEGKGVLQDYTEAVKWYRKAANQGHAKAQLALGDCYTEGTGVPKDGAEAAKWYRKASEQKL